MIRIETQFRFGSTLQNLMKVKNQIDGVNASAVVLNQNLANTARLLQGMGTLKLPAVGGGRAVGGAGGGRVPRPPYANPLHGMQTWAAAAASGNPVAIRNFNRFSSSFASQQRGQQRANQFLTDPTGRGAAIQNIFNRTRFANIGGKMLAMPLGLDIGRIAGAPAALGQGIGNTAANVASGVPGLGPLMATAIKLQTAAYLAPLTAFGSALAATTVVVRNFGQASVAGGARGAVAAATLSQGLGLNVGEVGRNLSAMGAAGLGLSPYTGPFGDLNYNARGLAALDSIRGAGSFEAARRRSAILTGGDTGLASAFLLDPKTYQVARGQGARGPDMAGMSAVASFVQAIVNLKNAFITAVEPVIIPTMKVLTETFNDIAQALGTGKDDALKVLGIALAAVAKTVTDAIKAVIAGFIMLNDIIVSILRSLHLMNDRDAADAQRRNTKALNDLNNTIRGTEGTFGGGNRASGATPSQLMPATNPAYRSVPYGAL